MRAEALSRKPGHAGAIAFSRTGDPSSGDFSDAKLIGKFGDVPDDLSARLRSSWFRDPVAAYLPLRDRLMRVTTSSQACSSSAG
jgi:hypothetical protein